MIFTSDQRLLKRINRMALVRLVQQHSGLSRSDLARRTGLTASAVGQLTQELIDDGWLAEVVTVSRPAVGRRPAPLALRTDQLALVGVDINIDRTVVVATDLTGDVFEFSLRETKVRAPQEKCDAAAFMLSEVVRKVVASGRRPLGIGVAAPGSIDPISGDLIVSESLGWRNLPVRQMLQTAAARRGLTLLPFYYERRSACAAFTKATFLRGGTGSMVYVHVGDRPFGASVLDGNIDHGARGLAGNIAHQQLASDGPLCVCGQRGCAMTLVGVKAISERAGVPALQLREMAESGDESAANMLREAGEYLGALLFNVWSMLSAQEVVIGGPGAQLGKIYFSAAESAFAALVAATGALPPPVSVVRFNNQTVAIGAAALVLQNELSPWMAANDFA